MNKEEVLKRAQQENKGIDAADVEAQQKGAWLSYLVGIIGIIAVNVINGIVLGAVNHGAGAVICLMAFVAFLKKYRLLKKKHELAVAVCYGALTAMFLSFWVLQLCRVW